MQSIVRDTICNIFFFSLLLYFTPNEEVSRLLLLWFIYPSKELLRFASQLYIKFIIYLQKQQHCTIRHRICRSMLELFSIGTMFRRSLFKFARITRETHFSGKTMCCGQILVELCTNVSHSTDKLINRDISYTRLKRRSII